MLELWHCADARSFRPLWMLEEMGLPYKLHLLPFPPRYLEPAFLERNPLGTIPWFEDSSTQGAPQCLSESSAILHYLVERHGPTPLALPATDPDYGAYINFLFQSDATFTFPQTITLRYRLFEKPENRQPKVADDYAKWFLARMRWVERHLSNGRDWLVAGRFTAADIAVGYACLLAGHLNQFADLGPSTRAWWARCEARDGYQRAKAGQAGQANFLSGR